MSKFWGPLRKTISAFVLEVAKNGPKLEKAVDGEAVTTTSTSDQGVTIQNVKMDSFCKDSSPKIRIARRES